MNKHILLFILLLIKVSYAVGQGASVSYRAVYDFDYTVWADEAKRNDKIFLDLNKDGSFCYSAYTYEFDSLMNTPNGEETFRKLVTAAFSKEGATTNAFPHKRSKFMITKNYAQKQAIVKESIQSEVYEYTVPIYDIAWAVTDSVRKICGYSCIKAIGEYHGRTWEVWFAPDLPFSDGPWQLTGLPGLIVQAQDKEQLFCFTLTGFSQSAGKKDWAEKGKKTTRQNFLKLKKKDLQNSGAMANALLGTNGTFDSKKKAVFLETDF